MERTIDQPIVPPAQSRSLLGSRGAARTNEPPVRLSDVWRDALHTFNAHPLVNLGCAWVGFAGASLLGAALSAPDSMDQFVRGQSTFCAYRETLGWSLLALGIPSMVLQTFAHGLITWIALRGGGVRGVHQSRGLPLRHACLAVLRYGPALLWSNLLYGLLMAGVVALLSVPLVALRLDPVNLLAGIRPDRAYDLIPREVSLHTANALAPAPGLPFCGIAGALRVALFDRWAPAGAAAWRMVERGTLNVYVTNAAMPDGLLLQPDVPGFWLVTLGAVGLAVLAETLLRFRVVATLAAQGGATAKRSRIVAPLVHSARLGWTHFGLVAAHTGLLRLGVAAVRVVFVALPIVMAERVAIPRVAQAAVGSWLYPACVLLVALSCALVDSLFTAFVCVYDARLYAALQNHE